MASRQEETSLTYRSDQVEGKNNDIVCIFFIFRFKFLAGSYVLEVQSALDPTVSLSMDDPICVGETK